MNIIKSIFLCVASLLFISCGMNNKEVHFPTRSLTAEILPIKEIIAPLEIIVNNNNLAVSCYQTDTLLYLYSIPELMCLGAGCIKGEGPEDYPSDFLLMCNGSQDKLYTWDLRLYIREIGLDSTGMIIAKNKHRLNRFQDLNEIYIWQDSLLIYNDIHNLSIKKQSLADSRLIDEITFKKDNHKKQSYHSNRGKVIANDSVIVYPYVYKDQIDIYDLHTFKLKKRIKGPGKTQIDSKNFGQENASLRYNINAIAGKKYFYTTFVKKPDQDEMEKSLVIRAYDYDGNPQIEYTFDVFPARYAVDEQNGYIYGYNVEKGDYFLRYKIN